MNFTSPTGLSILSRTSSLCFIEPRRQIYQSQHVARFLASQAYRDISIFIFQLNHALCPRQETNVSSPRCFLLTDTSPPIKSIQSIQNLLSEIESLVDLAPPETGPRRFGNSSFRTWHALYSDQLDSFLRRDQLGESLQVGNGSARQEVASYLLGAFGNPKRLDYGTGHELSFLVFLACLWKLGHFQDGNQGGEIEREIVLKIIEPYLRLVRKLVLTYTLEPAGSHGVWGLDDHFFIPYIFGSAQLARPIKDNDMMPTAGSVDGSPRPSDVIDPVIVEENRHLNMYFSAIGFINDVKKGSFWEHSPILFDISGIKDGWGKINKGMIKMFDAEVLLKFPVIQHFHFGILFSWDKVVDHHTSDQDV